MCGGFAVVFDVLRALPLLGFSAAPLMKVLAFIVCAASLSLCLLFFPPSFPPFPTLGEIYPLYLLGSSCPWPFLWGSGAVGPLPLFCSAPCFALCSFWNSDRFPGRDPVPLEASVFPRQTVQRREGLGALLEIRAS